MRVLGTAIVTEFKKSHASDAGCLAAKVRMLKHAGFDPKKDLDMIDWLGARNFDRVGRVVIIDACGNNVRIVAKTLYSSKPSTLRIVGIYTHAEYDKHKWS